MAKHKKPQQPEVVRRDGDLCVTFANTASRKRRSFTIYADLLAWGVRSGALTASDAERLGRAAAELPEEAAEVVDVAFETRSYLRRILEALVAGKDPDAADVDELNAAAGRALSARRLVPAAGGGWRWAWGDRGGDDLDRMLWPVVISAANLLASKHRLKVRRCAGRKCDLLFVDRTPGSPRKWCSMKACGGKIKALRHYRQTVRPNREAMHRKSGFPVKRLPQRVDDNPADE